MPIKMTLDDTIKASNGAMTCRSIARLSGVRPNTVTDIAAGRARTIKFETLARILDAMNELDGGGRYTAQDVFVYTQKER